MVTDLIKEALYELTNKEFDLNKDYLLYSYNEGTLYNINDLVRDTTIRNNSKVILI